MIPPVAWAIGAAAVLLSSIHRAITGAAAPAHSAQDGIHVYQTPLSGSGTPPSTAVPASSHAAAHTTPSHASHGTATAPHAASAARVTVPASNANDSSSPGRDSVARGAVSGLSGEGIQSIDRRISVAQAQTPDGTWTGALEIRSAAGRAPVRISVQMPAASVRAACAAGRQLFAQAMQRAEQGADVEGLFDGLLGGGSQPARGTVAANPFAQMASTLFAGPLGPALLNQAQNAVTSVAGSMERMSRPSPGRAPAYVGSFGVPLEYLPTVGLSLSDPNVAAAMLGEETHPAPGPYGAPVSPQAVARMAGPMLGAHQVIRNAVSAVSRTGDSELIVHLRAMLHALDMLAGQLLRSPEAVDRIASLLRSPLGYEAINVVRCLLGLNPTGTPPRRDYDDSDGEPVVSGADDSIVCGRMVGYYPRPGVGAVSMARKAPMQPRKAPHPALRNAAASRTQAANQQKVTAVRAQLAKATTHVANAKRAVSAAQSAAARGDTAGARTAANTARNAATAARSAATTAHTVAHQ